MSAEFRDYLKKIGSGPHTGKSLTRAEAARALDLMLAGVATPAQTGAFLIAHRIKRPEPEELAGFLDTYDRYCPPLPTLPDASPLVVLGHPYDGRTRTAPLTPIAALLLATAGIPVLLHGGERLPTKHGLPLVEILAQLGVNFRGLSRSQLYDCLATHQLGLLYTPDLFPATLPINEYRDQIGKRPPLASVELIWTPYQGPVNLLTGFVHPPTESFMQATLALRGVQTYSLIKGLEGSGDLPRERTALMSIHDRDVDAPIRLKLHARDYELAGPDMPLGSESQLLAAYNAAIAGQETEMSRAILWTGGFYLWRGGAAPDLATGIAQARSLLRDGHVQAKLDALKSAIAHPALAMS